VVGRVWGRGGGAVGGGVAWVWRKFRDEQSLAAVFAPVCLLLVSQTPEREGPGEYLLCQLDSVANSEEC